MMHKILLIPSLLHSAFWSVATEGKGSIRGLLFESETHTIMIEVHLDIPVEASMEDAAVFLMVPSWVPSMDLFWG